MLEDHTHKNPTHNFDGIIENRETKPPLYFTILFYGLIAWGVAFIAYFLLSGWSSEEEFKREMSAFKERTAQEQSSSQPSGGAAKDEKTSAAAAAEPIDAAALFSEHCSVCHGESGEGGIGSNLRDNKYEYGKSQAQIVESITQGRPGGMPGFANQLSAAKIEALAKYVREL